MFLIIIVILGNVTLAEDQIIFKSFKSESDIIYNGNQIFFDKPLVEIEGNTYVPLREAANKLDISVDWDNSSKTIKLLGDTSESDTVLTIAQRLYEVNLNGYVKLLDYSYFLDGIENMYQEYCYIAFKCLFISSRFFCILYFHFFNNVFYKKYFIWRKGYFRLIIKC